MSADRCGRRDRRGLRGLHRRSRRLEGNRRRAAQTDALRSAGGLLLSWSCPAQAGLERPTRYWFRSGPGRGAVSPRRQLDQVGDIHDGVLDAVPAPTDPRPGHRRSALGVRGGGTLAVPTARNPHPPKKRRIFAEDRHRSDPRPGFRVALRPPVRAQRRIERSVTPARIRHLDATCHPTAASRSAPPAGTPRDLVGCGSGTR